MKNKIIIGITAILMAAGAVVFANAGTANVKANHCPGKPACHCINGNCTMTGCACSK